MKRVLAAVVACAVVACGGVQTSLPGNSQVSTLSTDQMRQLCRDRQKYFESAYTTADRKTFGCNLGAVIGGAIASAFSGVDAGIAACQMTFTDCEAGKGSTAADGGTSDACAMVMADATCTATVADFNSCYAEQVETLRPYTKTSQCASLATADGGSPTATKTTTCDKIAPSCERAKTFQW
ncbi:MAG: hypothetical protein ABTQ32_15315 [Myxococcaceae bacterium]